MARGNKAPQKRGLKSSFSPMRLEFLHSHREEFRKAQQLGNPRAISKFYSRITNKWFVLFGYELPVSQDPPINVDEVIVGDLERIPGMDEGSEEDKAARMKIYQGMRTKLQQWFLHDRGKAPGAADSKEVKKLFAAIAKESARPPRKLSALAYYQKVYYQDRVKEAFKARYSEVFKAWQESCRSSADLQKPPAQLKIRNEVAAEQWAQESQEFRDELLQLLQEEHDREVEEAKRLEVTNEYADISQAMKEASIFLHAIAKGLEWRYGLAVSILMAGPMPEKGGSLEHSVHAGATSDAAALKWPNWDKEGYGQVESAMLKFADRVFPLSERALRVAKYAAALNAARSASGSEQITAPATTTAPTQVNQARGILDTPVVAKVPERPKRGSVKKPSKRNRKGKGRRVLIERESEAEAESTPDHSSSSEQEASSDAGGGDDESSGSSTGEGNGSSSAGEHDRSIRREESEIQEGSSRQETGGEHSGKSGGEDSGNSDEDSGESGDKDGASDVQRGAGKRSAGSAQAPQPASTRASTAHPQPREHGRVHAGSPANNSILSADIAPPQRLLANPPASTNLSGCPANTRHLYTSLTDAPAWTVTWTTCVSLFLAFERGNGFLDVNQRLPTSDARPAEFRDWFQAGREKRWPGGPTITDAAAFGSQLLAWWKDLQPAKRAGKWFELSRWQYSARSLVTPSPTW
ncbi:hypothetical protein CERSUDRAFT_98555 [Gelatoporia subvermispora B]|uniref:Uncharacterized protein n=1 Tax=Ceriporiopsis subvermispora (strain B) TaxID=914234 RepID=M2R5N6_CERS8|nr:hypothetical protein CERSUDRAFT_98555 [Gelatoporia subvermispora B]